MPRETTAALALFTRGKEPLKRFALRLEDGPVHAVEAGVAAGMARRPGLDPHDCPAAPVGAAGLGGALSGRAAHMATGYGHVPTNALQQLTVVQVLGSAPFVPTGYVQQFHPRPRASQ